MSDTDELTRFIETWHEAVEDVVELLRETPEEEWTRSTQLPGWTVHDVVAHLAHLESVLAGAPEETEPAPDAEHVASLSAAYTEQGVHARRHRTPSELLDELTTAAARRYEQLTSGPTPDPQAPAENVPGGLSWTWRTLLSNRIVDVWMHELDLRRALAAPGGFDSPAASHTAGVFALGMAYVVGKRVGSPPGTTVVFDLHDIGMAVPVEVRDDGRGHIVARPDVASVTLSMPVEAFVLLAGGRVAPEELDIEVDGDEPLGQQVLGAMAVTR